MVEDQIICLGLGCVIEPKVFTTVWGSSKHNLPNCQIVMFENILKKQIPPSIIDELLQKSLEELLAEAEEQIDNIASAFMTFLTQIRQISHNSITHNFQEIRRLQIIFNTTELKTVESLKGLQGDLRCLYDRSKVEAGMEISAQSQAKIIRQLKDQREELTNIFTKYNSNIASNIQSERQQILIESQAQDQQIIQQLSIPGLQIQPEPLQQANLQQKQQSNQWEQNVESNIQDSKLPKWISFSFSENRTLYVKNNQDNDITSYILTELVKQCIQLEPLKLKIQLNNTQISNIDPISELKSLLNLTLLVIDFGDNQVVDIKPISEFKSLLNLTSLVIHLQGNQVVDIKPISELKSLLNLTSLEIVLGFNQVVDIEPISELKSLLNLTLLVIGLGKNQVVDIKPISELKSLLNLTYLTIDIWGNQVVDIKPISDLKSLLNLTSLSIYLVNNQVVDFEPISELKSLLNLTSLEIDLGDNRQVDLKLFQELRSLQNLN